MNIKKTYIPGKPRNPKLGTTTGSSGVGRTDINQAVGSSHEHSNKALLDSISQSNIDVLEKLSVDDEGHIKVDATLWATGGVSALGLGEGGGSGGGGVDMLDSWANYTTAKADFYVPASLLVPFRNDTLGRLTSLESGSATSITTIGSGNAITSISKSGNVITANKELTFALATHTHTIAQITGLQGALDSKATPADIDTAIDSIEIGGRNLVIKTGSLEGYYLDGVWNPSYVALTPKDFIKVVPGGTYTMSIPISAYADNVVRMAMWDVNKDFVVRVTYNGGNQSQPIGIHTITIPNNVHFVTPGYGKDIDIKLEKGTKATDWTPAPEDQVSDWSTTDVTSFSYIKNKPTQLSQFTDNIGVATHIANKANPHAVTKAQVGLGNVDNVKQAAKSEFDTHTENSTIHITSTERTNWNDANSKKHTHSNKSTLDGITSTLVTNWNTAYTQRHTHANKTVIDKLTQSNIDVLNLLSVVDGNIKVDTTLWATGGISALGLGSGGGSGGGVDMLDDWTKYTEAKKDYYVTASLLVPFRNDTLSRLTSLESGSATSITTTGSGNAITSVSKVDNLLTFNKGLTFALSTHNHTIAQITGLQGALDLKATPADITTAIDGIEVGGRNLILNSNVKKQSGLYLIGNYDLSADLIDGQEYTVTVYADLPEGKYPTIAGTPAAVIYSYLIKKDVGVYTGTFTYNTNPTYPNNLTNKIAVYNGPNNSIFGGYISKIKLEKGNKPTDWTPAPENQVSDWNTTDVTSFSYIKNKPTQLSQFTDNIGVASHIANKANPHEVTTAQIGAVDLTTNQSIGGKKTFNTGIKVSQTGYQDFLVFERDASLWSFGMPTNNLVISNGDITDRSNRLITIGSNGNIRIGEYTPNPLYKLDVTGTGGFTGNVTAPTFIGALTGNASSATKLQTARTIAGVSFDGTANIAIPFNNLTAIPSTFAPSPHNHNNIINWSNAQTTSQTYSQLPNGVSVAFTEANGGYGSYGSVLNVKAYPASGEGTLQLYIPYSDVHGGTGLKYRKFNYNGDWGSLNTIWDSGNLTPVTLNTAQTITGAKTFSTLLTASAGTNTPKVDFGNGFTIEPSGTELVFKHNGVIKQRMLSDGTILATGGITALTT